MSGNEVTLTIDGREITVPAGTLLIRAAESIGVYIPRFCDHPLLDPLGACRQCLVEVEGQRKPLTACTTPVAEGMVVRTQASSDLAQDGQRGVLELLLINHPLDCPMCDKGGECPLQDQALAYGPGGSRYIDTKRRYTKPIPISPQIKLDRERCVLCARCTRFADQISGDPFIELFERGALEQIAVSEDEPYESVFSGNVVQICPVGALTSSSYRFRARPFDVQTTGSTCTRCASGCAIDVQTRRGALVRVLAKDDRAVNDEWICDKGRFATAYVEHPKRLTEPMVRKDGEFVAVTWAEAVRVIGERILETKERGGRIGVLAGDNLVDEDAYALSRFARTVLGTNDVDVVGSTGTEEERALAAALPRTVTATNEDIDRAKMILVVGSDLQQESPIVFLRARKAARARGTVLHEIGARRTALAGSGAGWTPCAPGGEADVLRAVAAALEAAGDSGLDPWTRAAASDAAGGDVAGLVAALTAAGGDVVILAGDRAAETPGALSLAWNIAIALGGRFGWIPRAGGARGAAWAGLAPATLPGGRSVGDPEARAAVADLWGAVPETPGADARAILAAKPAMLFLVGADPVADVAGIDAAMIEGAGFVVAHDMFLTASARAADVVLPVATAYERSGTVTNWEGRARHVAGTIPPPGLAQTDGEILAAVASAANVPFPIDQRAVRAEMRALAVDAGPARPLPVPDAATLPEAALRLLTYPLLIDEGSMMTGADTLAATGEGAFVALAPADAARAGIADGDQVTVSSARGRVSAPARVTDAMAPGAVFVPARQGGVSGIALTAADEPYPAVTIQAGA